MALTGQGDLNFRRAKAFHGEVRKGFAKVAKKCESGFGFGNGGEDAPTTAAGTAALRCNMLLGFAESEFSSYGAAVVISLHHYRRIRQGGLFHFYRDLCGTGGIGYCLRVERGSIGTGETESESGAGDCGFAFGDAQLHGEVAVGVNRGGILPLHVELLDRGQSFGFGVVENAFQMAFANRFEDEAMLVAELLLLLRIAEAGLGGGVGIGDSSLTNAAAAHKDLGLQKLFAFARFALHVVDGVAVFYVCIKAKNHKRVVIS
jgi:hypothetical protein